MRSGKKASGFVLSFQLLFSGVSRPVRGLGSIAPDMALASDDFGMGGPFETVKNVITGKWGKMISIAGMACCGIAFIFAAESPQGEQRGAIEYLLFFRQYALRVRGR